VNMKYWLAILFVLLTVFLALSTCIAEQGEMIELTYWHGWTMQWEEMVKYVCAEFEEDHPNIKVNQEVTGNLIEKLITSVVAGNPPDIVTVYSCENLFSLAAKGLLLPYDDYATEEEIRITGEWMLPMVWELSQWNGKVYGLSYWMQATALAWNCDHFAEAGLPVDAAPKTTSDLFEYSKKLTKYTSEDRIERMGFLPGHTLHWMNAFGGSLFDEEKGVFTPDDPANVRALKWMKTFYDYYGLKDIQAWQATLASERAGVNDPFVAGQVSVQIIGGPWKVGDFKKYGMPDKSWTVGPSPSPEEIPSTSTWTYGDFTVVPRGTKHPREAWEFVRFTSGASGNLGSYARVLYWGGRPINVPVSPVMLTHESMEDILDRYPEYRTMIEIFMDPGTRIGHPPKTPVANEYMGKLWGAGHRVIWEDTWPQEVLSAIKPEIQARHREALEKSGQ